MKLREIVILVVSIGLIALLCYRAVELKVENVKLGLELQQREQELAALRKSNELYFNQANFLAAVLRQGWVLPEDMEVKLKKGSMVIPAEVFERLKGNDK